MKSEAKLILEHIIRELDKSVPPNADTLKSQVETIDPNDEDALQKQWLNLEIISATREVTYSAVQKMLVGENILTPCLTRNGWKFWRQPLLTSAEKEAIETASLKISNESTEKLNSLMNSLERIPDKDTLWGLIGFASMADAKGESMQQLSAELKEMLPKA